MMCSGDSSNNRGMKKTLSEMPGMLYTKVMGHLLFSKMSHPIGGEICYCTILVCHRKCIGVAKSKLFSWPNVVSNIKGS